MSRVIWPGIFFATLLLAGGSLVVGAAYLLWWASDPSAHLRHEALIGSAMALGYGLPLAVAALLLARWRPSFLPGWAIRTSVMLLTAIVAVLATSVILSGRDT
jgi:hypothetical protein